jgi:hypothetical protein
MVLNQDLQDLEDFYKRGVGWNGACRSMRIIFYQPFLYFVSI